MMMRLLVFLLMAMIANEIFAQESHYLRRSPRGILMGDAYTAVADDEYTLFYNPAALGRHKGISVYFIDPEVSATNVLGEMDRFKNFPKRDAAAIADRIIGLLFIWVLEHFPGLKCNTLA
jgi:hypothetical protein